MQHDFIHQGANHAQVLRSETENFISGTIASGALGRITSHHTTAIMASSFVYGGDDRFYQNIFVGGADTYGQTQRVSSGTADFNGHPASYEEFIQNIEEAFPGDCNLYAKPLILIPIESGLISISQGSGFMNADRSLVS